MELELGSQFRRINIARLHNEVANDIRQEHVQWIDSLNRDYGKNLDWWFGAICSRNVYSSNLFQYSCYLEMIDRLWKTPGERPELIIIESIGIAKAICKWAHKENIYVNVICYYLAKIFFLKWYLISFLQWGEFVIDHLLRWVAAYVSREKYKYKVKHTQNHTAVIVNTYVHDYSLSDNGNFKDRYFPYLHEYLSEKGFTVAIHPVLFGFKYNYFSIYNRMRKSNSQFILQEDFLRALDYLIAISFPLRILKQKIKSDAFRSFDLSDILEEEQRQQSFIPGIQAVLIYRLFLRLGKVGIKPKMVINWYENQVIDRALIVGARQSFLQARILGVQGFVHSPNFLSLFPSQSEVEVQMAPHLLLETSQYQCQIACSFTRDIPCKPVAALRYSHVFDEDTTNYNGRQKLKSILVLLSFNIAEAVELLEILKAGLNQIRGDINILIKGHPDYDSKNLVRAFGVRNWPSRYEIFHGSLPDALRQVSLVLSSGSSSMIEAVSKGVPVIFLGRQTGLNHNILSNLNMDIVTECYSTMELINAINKYVNLSSVKIKEYKNMGKKIRELFFTPVNEKTMEPFLDILNN
ncbi:MAG: hypothetical protein Q6358_03950 [Candidatus Brocadiales bacterium]|nr:hypothetical protein [Candidatus Brocadiales bacterium]